MDVPTHPTDPSMMAWFTTATGDELGNTLERAAHRVLMEFYEHHLPGLISTVVALFPVQDEGDPKRSEHLATASNPALPTYHARWVFTARYTQHVSSLLQEVIAVGTH
jgi:hypothetical protein